MLSPYLLRLRKSKQFATVICEAAELRSLDDVVDALTSSDIGHGVKGTLIEHGAEVVMFEATCSKFQVDPHTGEERVNVEIGLAELMEFRVSTLEPFHSNANPPGFVPPPMTVKDLEDWRGHNGGLEEVPRFAKAVRQYNLYGGNIGRFLERLPWLVGTPFVADDGININEYEPIDDFLQENGVFTRHFLTGPDADMQLVVARGNDVWVWNAQKRKWQQTPTEGLPFRRVQELLFGDVVAMLERYDSFRLVGF